MRPLEPLRTFALLVALVATCGCTKLKDDGYATQSDAGEPDAPPCRHAAPPERPDVPADVPGDLDLVFSAQEVDFGDDPGTTDSTPRFMTFGYDLDGVCTGHGNGDSCAEPPWARIEHTDGVDGRDNGITFAFYRLVHAWGWLTHVFKQPEGKQAMVIRLRDYDGTMDDSHVSVDLYAGSLWSSETDMTGPAAERSVRDRWKIGSAWLETPTEPGAPYDTSRSRFRDPDGYVAGGVLVTHLRTVLMGSPYLPVGLLQAAIMTGHVEKTENGDWVLRNGMLTGRWTMDDLIRLMSYYSDSAAQRSLCADSNAFQQAKEQFCPFMDIRVEGGDPSLPCDGMSMAYAFDADPAGMGAVVDDIPSPQTCTPENDPVTHGCGVP